MPPHVLQIVEILERSEQGQTRPFRCRADDGRSYFVKGVGAGRRSLWCEWLAGHLALALGLPVPPIAIVQASESLVRLHPEGAALGAAPAFGSQIVDHPQELTVSHFDEVPVDVQRDVLVFDWWVHNSDRTLSAHGGNPNLLWDAAEKHLAVIDHNDAFDEQFDSASFGETHAFSEQIDHVFQDLVERQRYVERLREALAIWPGACQNVPKEWWFADEERTVPANFDPDAALILLNRCLHEDFWRLAP